jgi:Xaa-Pro aminopeptidase
MRQLSLIFCLFLLFGQQASSQDMWKYFKPEDFAARRQKVIDYIGDGLAIFQGASLPEPYIKFRQDNNFYYLTGVEIPDAVLVINGKSKKSILFIPDHIPEDIKVEARIKANAEDTKTYKLDMILPKPELTGYLGYFAGQSVPFYCQTEAAELMEMTRDRSQMYWIDRINDPWDGRVSREQVFINKLKERYSTVTVKSITPLMDSLRWVKDQKEIAVLRECGRIGSLGFDEAMKVTKPGMYEYQLVASCDYVYQNNGTDPAYFAIAASGERGLMWHYNANNHQLKEGEVILIDYAPQLNYYATDITRTWPVSGKFTAQQLKFYNVIKDMRAQVMSAMKPGITLKAMEDIGKAVFIKHGMEKYWIGYVGHFVGLSVHDVGPYDKPFVPGVVFNLEPLIEDKELKFHLRLEDTIVITETGYENLTPQSPVEPEDIYKMMKEKPKKGY